MTITTTETSTAAEVLAEVRTAHQQLDAVGSGAAKRAELWEAVAVAWDRYHRFEVHLYVHDGDARAELAMGAAALAAVNAREHAEQMRAAAQLIEVSGRLA